MAQIIESGADSIHLSESAGYIWLTIGVEGKRGIAMRFLPPLRPGHWPMRCCFKQSVSQRLVGL